MKKRHPSTLLRNGSLKEAGRRKQARDSFHLSLSLSLCILPSHPWSSACFSLHCSSQPGNPLLLSTMWKKKKECKLRQMSCVHLCIFQFLKISAVIYLWCPLALHWDFIHKKAKVKDTLLRQVHVHARTLIKILFVYIGLISVHGFVIWSFQDWWLCDLKICSYHVVYLLVSDLFFLFYE